MQRLSTSHAIVIALGMFLGLWHLRLAASALFVFREGEPWTSWVAIIAGPGATLALVVVSIAYIRASAFALCAFSVVGLIALAIERGPDYDITIWYFARITLPMAVLGAALLAVSRADSLETTA